MSDVLTDEEVAAVKDLIRRSQVKAIEYHEVSARLTGSTSTEPSGDGNVDYDLQYRVDEDVFGFRLLTTITTDFGEAVVGVAVVYEYAGDAPLKTVLQFGNEVGVMTVFPFVREAVGSITAKVFGQPIMLPLMERGDVSFNLDDLSD